MTVLDHTPTEVEDEFLAAYAGRDWPRLVALVDDHWTTLTFSQKTYRQMWDALGAAPQDALRRAPKAALIAEVSGRLPGGSTTVPVPVGDVQIDRALRDGTARDLLELALLGIIARRSAGLPKEAYDLARASRPLIRATATTRFSVAADLAAYWHLQAGQASLHAGHLESALVDFRHAWTFRGNDVTGYVATAAAPFIVLLSALSGDTEESAHWQRVVGDLEPEGRDLIEWETMERPRAVGRLLEAADRLDLGAGERVTAVLLAQLVFDEIWPITLFAIVRHLVGTGEVARAQRLVEETVALHAAAPAQGSFYGAFVGLARTEVALALGQVTVAARLLARPDAALLPGLTSIYAVRLELLAGDLPAALRLAAVAARGSEQRTRAEATLLHSAIRLAEHDAPGAAPELSPSLLRTASLLPPQLHERLRTALGGVVPGPNPALSAPDNLAARLTAGETRVLDALHGTGTLPEIAALLHISRNTIKTHLRALYRKLGVSSREEAVAVAARLGLGRDDEGPPP